MGARRRLLPISAVLVAVTCGGSDDGPSGGPGNLPCGVAVSGVPTISVSLPAGTEAVELDPIETGLGFLTHLASPPEDSRRFVVTEKTGRAWMFLDGTRYVFASYTNAAGHTRVERYHVPPGTETVDPNSATLVLAQAQPADNHNGGQIAFGPDGRLYVGLGDGGGGNDVFCSGQDPTTLLGKLLRVDVDGATGPTGMPEIWSLGLRNP